MLKTYIFANALRLRKGIDYLLDNEKENRLASLVTIAPWIDLVNKYTLRDYPDYSIRHILNEYVKGNIDVRVDYPEVYKSCGEVDLIHEDIIGVSGISFYNKEAVLHKFPAIMSETRKWLKKVKKLELYSKAIMYDDIVYDSVNIWYTVVKERLVGKEIFLNNKGEKKALILSVGDPSRLNLFHYASLVFTKWFLENTELEEFYYIIPVPKEGEHIHSCDPTDRIVSENTITEPLEDGYIKYRFLKKHIEVISYENIKRAYKIVGN